MALCMLCIFICALYLPYRKQNTKKEEKKKQDGKKRERRKQSWNDVRRMGKKWFIKSTDWSGLFLGKTLGGGIFLHQFQVSIHHVLHKVLLQKKVLSNNLVSKQIFIVKNQLYRKSHARLPVKHFAGFGRIAEKKVLEN